MISESHKKLDEPASDGRVKKATTPLPKGKIFVICWIMFADFYGVLLILPFLPFMVSDFFPELDRTEIGKKAGFLGSAYYIGCLGGSFMWGWLADITGRRPALLCCICCIIVNFALFGFSQNFAWAVCTRLLWGLLDGVLGLSKTYISEICDETNQSKGFAMIATMGGIGRIFGSLTGGFLARPASKYPLLNIPFFCNFPYMLPCLVGVFANIVSLILAWLFLPETLKKEIKKLEPPTATTNDSDVINNSMTITSDDSINDLEEGCEKQPLLSLHKHKKIKINKLKKLLKKAWCKLVTMANLMKDRRVLLTSALYGLLAFTVIMVDLVFPLLMVTDHRHGGYDMDDNEIGIFLSISSLAAVLYQVLGYSPLGKLLGYRNSFRVGLAVFAIGCILMPLANHISGPILDGHSDNSNSTHGFNATLWNFTADSNMVAMVDYNDYHFNHLWTFSTLYGSKYQSQSDITFSSSVVGYYGNTSSDNNLTNNSCHSSRLGSTVGKNSIKRIPARVWLTLSWILAMMTIGRLTGFTSVSIMIGNSVLSVTRGTVYGIGQSLGSLGRSTGPLIGTPLFAWSERNGHGWPLNYHFIYDVTAVMVVIVILISFALPKSTEKKRLPDPVKPQTTNIHYSVKNK